VPSTEDSGKYKRVTDQFADVEIGGLAAAPDGGIAPGPIGDTPQVPAATPEQFICLRGPCRYYWQLETFFASGNPTSTWDPEHGLKDEHGNPLRQPSQISRSCLVHPGTETELTDDLVYDCSRWDPLTPREAKRREKRRSRYLKLHPDHRSR
jgi:hypothetical protein